MGERLIHTREHTIERPGLSYHVLEVYGDGISDETPPVVMLHGFAGSSQSMVHLAEELASQTRVFLIDLAGHGASLASPKGSAVVRYSTLKQAEDLHHILIKLELYDVILYGYSMGGRLAIQYLVRSASNDSDSATRIKHAVLESTTFGLETKSDQSARRRQDDELVKSIISNMEEFVQTWDEKPVFRTSTPPTTELSELSKKIRATQSPEHLAASLIAFGTGAMPYAGDKLGIVNVPIIFITGEEDTKFTEINSRMMKLLNDEIRSESEHHIIPKAGHRVHLEKPESVLELISKTL